MRCRYVNKIYMNEGNGFTVQKMDWAILSSLDFLQLVQIVPE